MVMIYAVGHVSGAHFNPAVTIAFALTRHFPWREVVWYVGGQVIGALGFVAAEPGHLGPVEQRGEVEHRATGAARLSTAPPAIHRM